MSVWLLACWTPQAVPQTDTAPAFPNRARIGDLVFERGVPIAEMTLPAATGGNVDAAINNGELSDYSFDPVRLPPGLNFDRFTRVMSGTPTYPQGRTAYRLWVHDDDENWAVSDGDSLRFTIEVLDSTASGSTEIERDGDGRSSLPDEFAASFESELQWFQRDRWPHFSGVVAWEGAAWRGERISKQILVAGATARGGVFIVAGDLRSGANGAIPAAGDLRSEANDVIPAAAVKFRYPHFVIGDVFIGDCEGYPPRSGQTLLSDALFPEPPARLPRDFPQMVWMSIDVPEDIRPGSYSGTVSVRSGGETRTSRERAQQAAQELGQEVTLEGTQQVTLEVSLEVLPWQLPAAAERRFHLDLWQFPVSVLERYNDANPRRRIEVWSEEHYELLEPFYRYLAELGQRAVSTYIKEGAHGAPSMIDWIALENGQRWTYDYSNFDAHVERLAAWGIDGQINAFSPVGWNKDEIPFRDEESAENKIFKADVGSPTYNALWNNFLTDFKRHLMEKGWFEKTVLYMDEVPEDEMEAVIGLIRYNDPGWKIGLAYGHAPNDRVVGSLYDASGFYESEIDVQTYDHQVTTFYTSCANRRPNNFVAADAHPADMVAIPWYALARGHDGYLRWAFDNFKSYDPLDLRDGLFAAGDYSFVYRSSNERDMTAIPSVRSELLRDGIEDFEKLHVLLDHAERCGRDDMSAGLRDAVGTFSTDALRAGQAVSLVPEARARLNRLARSVAPHTCR